MKQLSALLLIALPLAGCSSISESRLNPTNWWDDAPRETLEPEGGYTPTVVDNRPLVAEVNALRIEPTLGGIIIHATGLPPFQQYWDAELVQVSEEIAPAGTLVYNFRLSPPVTPVARGTTRSRQVEAAAFASSTDLRGISRITVNGATNSQSRSR